MRQKFQKDADFVTEMNHVHNAHANPEYHVNNTEDNWQFHFEGIQKDNFVSCQLPCRIQSKRIRVSRGIILMKEKKTIDYWEIHFLFSVFFLTFSLSKKFTLLSNGSSLDSIMVAVLNWTFHAAPKTFIDFEKTSL